MLHLDDEDFDYDEEDDINDDNDNDNNKDDYDNNDNISVELTSWGFTKLSNSGSCTRLFERYNRTQTYKMLQLLLFLAFGFIVAMVFFFIV